MGRIVVADAGPLHYLILIDAAFVLETLFEQVLIPTAVRDELSHQNTPAKVRAWLAENRAWLKIETMPDAVAVPGLHRGEAEALQLALQAKAAGVLMDDMDGRLAARRLGLMVIGTIGLLERAAELRLLDLPQAIARLRLTNMFVSEEVLEAALARALERLP